MRVIPAELGVYQCLINPKVMIDLRQQLALLVNSLYLLELFSAFFARVLSGSSSYVTTYTGGEVRGKHL
ncbi:hypothetical protein [Pseudoalteromonas rhizosphaerae]|uniref:Uncharacterized protein n=1 Tax=Pseudoalteromonas rhizosphaerae TaxID=2518973 RepID=A0ABW8L2G9_9GAMM